MPLLLPKQQRQSMEDNSNTFLWAKNCFSECGVPKSVAALFGQTVWTYGSDFWCTIQPKNVIPLFLDYKKKTKVKCRGRVLSGYTPGNTSRDVCPSSPQRWWLWCQLSDMSSHGDRQRVDTRTGIVEIKRMSKKDDFRSVHSRYRHQPRDVVKSRSDTDDRCHCRDCRRRRRLTVCWFATPGLLWRRTRRQTRQTLVVQTHNIWQKVVINNCSISTSFTSTK